MISNTSNYNSDKKQLCDVTKVSVADTNLLFSQLSPKAGPSGLQAISQPSLSLLSPSASSSLSSSKIVPNLSLNQRPSSISPKVLNNYQAQPDPPPNGAELDVTPSFNHSEIVKSLSDDWQQSKNAIDILLIRLTRLSFFQCPPIILKI